MRCSFCFADNQNSGETCAVCGSPLRGLPPQKAVAPKQSSTRLERTTTPLPQSHAILSKPTKRKNAAQEQSAPQEVQLVARRKVDETILSAAFWTQNRQDDSIIFVTRRGELQLWNPQNDTSQTLFSMPRANTTSACLMAGFDVANGRVVLAFEDGKIELVNVARGASSTRLLDDGAKATSLAMASEAQILAVAGEDGTIRLWDLGSVQPTPPPLDLCGLHRVAIAPNATWLACGDDSGQVQVWNLQASRSLAQPQWSFDAHRLWVSALAFSPNAQMLASGGYDGTVRLYASQNGFEMARFPESNQNANCGAVSALCFAGNRFVAIASAQEIALLDCWAGTTTPLTHLASAATHLTASHDGALLLALCRDEALLLRLPTSPL